MGVRIPAFFRGYELSMLRTVAGEALDEKARREQRSSHNLALLVLVAGDCNAPNALIIRFRLKLTAPTTEIPLCFIRNRTHGQ